ncbi:MAG: LysR family transcriptional regulator [Rhodothermales bacterium]|nr:LysR family transcriptional regulator [Rhodothermales bacterium]
MDPLSNDQLRTFVSIVQEGSYTAAAQKLFRTQPALSLQIKKLEEQIGSRVLERNGRQTRPTAAGEVLLSYAIRILDLNEEVVNKLSVTDTEGSVKIGVLEEVAIGPLVDLLTKFGRLCTKIDLDFRVATSWELSRLIKENRICLAVANTEYAASPAVPLWSENYVWAANPEYDFLARDVLPLVADPMDLPCEVRDIAVRLLERAGRKYELVFSSSSLQALQAAIRAGLGVGIIAESAVTEDMVVIQSGDGLPQIPAAHIGLYRGTAATSTAVDCLAEFLIGNLQAIEYASLSLTP